MINTWIFFIGGIMMTLAPNVYWLIPARLIVGFASGLASVVVSNSYCFYHLIWHSMLYHHILSCLILYSFISSNTMDYQFCYFVLSNFDFQESVLAFFSFLFQLSSIFIIPSIIFFLQLNWWSLLMIIPLFSIYNSSLLFSI